MYFSKKINAIVFFLVLIFLLYYFLSSSSFSLNITSYFASTKPEKNVSFALDSLIKGKSDILVDTEKENTCYWIKTTMKKGKYFLEISEYENIGKIRGCIGILKDTKYIEINHPINLNGIDCVCGGRIHRFEMDSKGHLKISKSGKLPPIPTSTTTVPPLLTTEVSIVSSTTTTTKPEFWRRVNI